jgi:tRNA dimethylallyltransferase
MSLPNGCRPSSKTEAGKSSASIPILVGPTGVGKTELSIRLADCLGAEIVSIDSRLFYRGMDIGTAKPSYAERERIPHHLIDIADPRETLSLSTFQKLATETIGDIQLRGKIPLLVGGSGQYARAITQGWTPPEVAPDNKLRAELENKAKTEGVYCLYEELMRLDPEAALKIDPRNVRRTIRALEVIYVSGKKFSDQRGRSDHSKEFTMLGLTRSRPELYQRVDIRVDRMFSDGLLEEVRRLLDAGVSPQLPAMSSIGYRECVLVLQGFLSTEEAKTMMRRATRVLIRRQSNWFKTSDPLIKWFDASTFSETEIISKIVSSL